MNKTVKALTILEASKFCRLDSKVVLALMMNIIIIALDFIINLYRHDKDQYDIADLSHSFFILIYYKFRPTSCSEQDFFELHSSYSKL